MKDSRLIKPGKILNAQGVPIQLATMDLKVAAKTIETESCECKAAPGEVLGEVVCKCYKKAAKAMMIGAAQLLKTAAHQKERADKLEEKYQSTATELVKAQNRIKELEAHVSQFPGKYLHDS